MSSNRDTLPSPASALASDMQNQLSFVAGGHPGQPVAGFTAVSGVSSAKMDAAARFAALAGPQHWNMMGASASLAAAPGGHGRFGMHPAHAPMATGSNPSLLADDSHGSADTYGLPTHPVAAPGAVGVGISSSLGAHPGAAQLQHPGSFPHAIGGHHQSLGHTNQSHVMLGAALQAQGGGGGNPGLSGSPMTPAQRSHGHYPAGLSSDGTMPSYSAGFPALHAQQLQQQQQFAADLGGDSTHVAPKRMREQMSQSSHPGGIPQHPQALLSGQTDVAMGSGSSLLRAGSMQLGLGLTQPPMASSMFSSPTPVGIREERKQRTAALMTQAFAADPEDARDPPSGAFVYIPPHQINQLASVRAMLSNQALIMDWDELVDITSVALHDGQAATRMRAKATLCDGRVTVRDPAPYGDAHSSSSSSTSAPGLTMPGQWPQRDPVPRLSMPDAAAAAALGSGSMPYGMPSGASYLHAGGAGSSGSYGGAGATGAAGATGHSTGSSGLPDLMADSWTGMSSGFSPGNSASHHPLGTVQTVGNASSTHAVAATAGAGVWQGWQPSPPGTGMLRGIANGPASRRATPPTSTRTVEQLQQASLHAGGALSQRLAGGGGGNGGGGQIHPAMLSALAASSSDSNCMSPTFTGASMQATPDTSGLHALSLAAGELTTTTTASGGNYGRGSMPTPPAPARSASHRRHVGVGAGRPASERGRGTSAETATTTRSKRAAQELTSARMRRSLVQDSRVPEGTRSGTVSSKEGVSWGRVNNPVVYVENSGLPPTWPSIPLPLNYLHTNLPPDDGRSGRLTKQSVSALRFWMTQGYTWLSPYPTTADVSKLSVETGMSAKQLRDWFRNERKRVWLPFWQSRLSDPDCLWVVQRSSGGRANIIPRHVMSRFQSYTSDLDLMTAIALDRDATDGPPPDAKPSEPGHASGRGPTTAAGSSGSASDQTGRSPGTASARSLPGTGRGSIVSQAHAPVPGLPLASSSVRPPHMHRMSATPSSAGGGSMLVPVGSSGVAVYPTVPASSSLTGYHHSGYGLGPSHG